MENVLLIRCIRYAKMHIYSQFQVVGKAAGFLQVKIKNWKQLNFVEWWNSIRFGCLRVYFCEAINHIQASQNGVCAYLCIHAFQSDQQIAALECGVESSMLNNIKQQSKKINFKERTSFIFWICFFLSSRDHSIRNFVSWDHCLEVLCSIFHFF